MSVVVDEPARWVRRIRINRPDARNAIDDATRLALLTALSKAEEDVGVRAVVLGGTEGIFSAGGDLPSLIGLSFEAALARLSSGHEIVTLAWEFPKPVISAVERFAVGAGAGLALLADDVVVGRSAAFMFPFPKLGLIPDWGITGSLELRTGWPVACRLLRDGATVKGEEAFSLHIADRLTDDDAVMQEAIELAALRADQALDAFAGLKTMLRGRAESRLNLDLEARTQAMCITSPAFAEGYAAFQEKRAPRFTP